MVAFGASYPRNDQPVRQASPDEREVAFERRWQIGGLNFMGAFGDLLTDSGANEFAADFVRHKIRAVVRAAGCLHQVDAIVFATGFDAMTGSLLKPDIRGRGGLSLRDKWQAGPLNYLGLSVHGFPNMFTVCGPGSPSVLTNMLVSIEQHVRWITDCMVWMRGQGKNVIEAETDAEASWVGHVNAVAGATLFPSCNSWYLGANVPGKVRVFMPLLGFPAYVQKCDAVAAQGYAGFHLA